MVGSAYLRRLTLTNLALDIVLIDKDKSKLEGEILDLTHSLALENKSIKIRVGDYDEVDDADIIVLTAGITQSTNDRLKDLKEANEIVKDIADNLVKRNFKGIYLVATNPLDVITYLFAYYLDYPYNKVIGTGCMLDTIRLKTLISNELNVSPIDINIYVLGEHGNSQVTIWTNANYALTSLNNYFNEDEKKLLSLKTIKMGSSIVKSKGYTNEGVSFCLIELTLVILKDLKKVYCVSNYNSHYDTYLSTPCLIGKKGIEKNIDIKLSQEEEILLLKSSKIINEAIDTILPKELY